MIAKAEDLAGLRPWPRLMRRAEAAAYLGLPMTTFDAGVTDGTWPDPIQIDRFKLWDRHALDRAVDALSGLLVPSKEADEIDWSRWTRPVRKAAWQAEKEREAESQRPKILGRRKRKPPPE